MFVGELDESHTMTTDCDALLTKGSEAVTDLHGVLQALAKLVDLEKQQRLAMVAELADANHKLQEQVEQLQNDLRSQQAKHQQQLELALDEQREILQQGFEVEKQAEKAHVNDSLNVKYNKILQSRLKEAKQQYAAREATLLAQLSALRRSQDYLHQGSKQDDRQNQQQLSASCAKTQQSNSGRAQEPAGLPDAPEGSPTSGNVPLRSHFSPAHGSLNVPQLVHKIARLERSRQRAVKAWEDLSRAYHVQQAEQASGLCSHCRHKLANGVPTSHATASHLAKTPVQVKQEALASAAKVLAHTHATRTMSQTQPSQCDVLRPSYKRQRSTHAAFFYAGESPKHGSQLIANSSNYATSCAQESAAERVSLTTKQNSAGLGTPSASLPMVITTGSGLQPLIAPASTPEQQLANDMPTSNQGRAGNATAFVLDTADAQDLTQAPTQIHHAQVFKPMHIASPPRFPQEPAPMLFQLKQPQPACHTPCGVQVLTTLATSALASAVTVPPSTDASALPHNNVDGTRTGQPIPLPTDILGAPSTDPAAQLSSAQPLGQPAARQQRIQDSGQSCSVAQAANAAESTGLVDKPSSKGTGTLSAPATDPTGPGNQHTWNSICNKRQAAKEPTASKGVRKKAGTVKVVLVPHGSGLAVGEDLDDFPAAAQPLRKPKQPSKKQGSNWAQAALSGRATCRLSEYEFASAQPAPAVNMQASAAQQQLPSHSGVTATHMSHALRTAPGHDLQESALAQQESGWNSTANYKYAEVVRKKDEREALAGWSCPECERFYKALATWGAVMGDQPKCGHEPPAGAGNAHATARTAGASALVAASVANQLRQDTSRHRMRYAPPATPEGFWDMGFQDSLDVRHDC